MIAEIRDEYYIQRVEEGLVVVMPVTDGGMVVATRHNAQIVEEADGRRKMLVKVVPPSLLE